MENNDPNSSSIFKSLFLSFVFVSLNYGILPSQEMQQVFSEEEGILTVELEDLSIVSNNWQVEDEANDFSGTGYIYWAGEQFLNETGQGEIICPIQINKTGTYRLLWRMMVGKGEDVTDHNDNWLKIEGAQIYGEKPDGHKVLPKPLCETTDDFDCPNGSSTKGFFKVYGQDLAFTWQSYTSDHDGHAIYANFKKPGEYKIIINARSSHCYIDKILLYNTTQWTEYQATRYSDLNAGLIPKRKTVVSIQEDQFLINGELTYKGRYFEGKKIEGLLFNARLVQGIFDDLNQQSRAGFAYPDTKTWDPERNTNEFVAAMSDWNAHGLLAFTLNLQGGSPLGYGNKDWINSTFTPKGNLSPAYLDRLERILDKADELGMVVILGYFYFGQDQYLEDENAVINAVDNITQWILDKGYRNILVELSNECDINYDHNILNCDRISELIKRVHSKQKNGDRLLVGTSFSGGHLPDSQIVAISDYILLHGNGVSEPAKIESLVKATRTMKSYKNQPILFNEDDHYDFDKPNNNLMAAIRNYSSWGYFDFRREGESFENGFQSVPVDWQINSKRKTAFFKKIKEITAY